MAFAALSVCLSYAIIVGSVICIYIQKKNMSLSTKCFLAYTYIYACVYLK